MDGNHQKLRENDVENSVQTLCNSICNYDYHVCDIFRTGGKILQGVKAHQVE